MFLFCNGLDVHRSESQGGVALCGIKPNPVATVTYTAVEAVDPVSLKGTECAECIRLDPYEAPDDAGIGS